MFFKNFFGKFRVGYRFLEDLLYNKDNSMKERMESMATEPLYIKIKENDNVAITVHAIPAGTEIMEGVVSRQEIPQGHKIALEDIKKDAPIRRYGVVLGYALDDIPQGSWINEHMLRLPVPPDVRNMTFSTNIRTDLPKPPVTTWEGYRNAEGYAGTRNYLESSPQCSVWKAC